MNSALREMLIKIGIVSDVAGAEKAERALSDTADAAERLDAGAGKGADAGAKLADALDAAGTAAKDAGRDVEAAGEAAGDLAGQAMDGADGAGDLAGALGKSAAGAAAMGAAMLAAQASISLVVRLTREYIEVLKAEAKAIEDQKTANISGAIDMTRSAVARLGEEYDKLAARRRADLAVQQAQIDAEKEYALAVNERQMQQAIDASPGDEKRIRKDYGARAKGISASAARASTEAEIQAAAQKQADTKQKARDLAESEARAMEEARQARERRYTLANQRDEAVAKAGSRTPYWSPMRRVPILGLYTEAWHDARFNREARAKEVGAKLAPGVADAQAEADAAEALVKEAQKKRKDAEAAAAAAKAEADSLKIVSQAQGIREESAQIEQRRAGAAPLSPEDQAEAQAMQAEAQQAYDKAASLEKNAEANKGAAADLFRDMAGKSRAEGDAIIQALSEKFGAIAEKLSGIETAQQQEREATAQAIAQLNQQWSDLAARVASLPS